MIFLGEGVMLRLWASEAPGDGRQVSHHFGKITFCRTLCYDACKLYNIC
jgi:hypothetical protein